MQKISELLVKAGTDRVIAGVIEVLADGSWHTMREIELAANLRQPEVSIAIGTLAEYLETKTASGARGRPQKCVRGVRLREYVKKKVDAVRDEYNTKLSVLHIAMGQVVG